MLCRFERSIFQSSSGYCVFGYQTNDKSVPMEARNDIYYHDRKIHITAVGYNLPATDTIDVELVGTWSAQIYIASFNPPR